MKHRYLTLLAASLATTLALAQSDMVLAANPIKSITIVPSSTGDLDAAFPAGDDPGGGYEALQFAIGDALDTAGMDTIACGTSGTDFSHDVRQYLSGTNAATAPIVVNFVSGDDFADEGGTEPNTGDDVTFECVNPTLSKGGSIRFCADDGLSSHCSGSKQWASFGITPPTDDRDLIWDSSYDSGQFNPLDFQVDGVYKDAGNLHQSYQPESFTITNITNTNPAVAFWTGTDPLPYQHFQMPETGGIAQLRGKSVTCRTPDTAANSCQLSRTGDENGHYGKAWGFTYPPTATADDQIQTCKATKTFNCQFVNAIGYSAWSGGSVTAKTTARLETQNGGQGTSSTDGTHIVSSVTPPANDVGTSAVVTPLANSSHFLSSTIFYDRDHATFPGNGGKNKPRFIQFAGRYTQTNPVEIPIPYGEEACLSVGIFLPTNYDHSDQAATTSGSGINATDNQLISIPPYTDENHDVLVSLNGGAGGVDHWWLRYFAGLGSSETYIDMGSVVPDLGKWTVFTIKFKRHVTTGTLKVWKSENDVIGAGGKRADVLKHNSSGGLARIVEDAKFQIRQYRYSWHTQPGHMDSRVSWIGYDEFRLTRFVTDGGTCEDVHPFREPLT